MDDLQELLTALERHGLPRINRIEECLIEHAEVIQILVVAIQDLGDRIENMERRLTAVERATPWRAPKKQPPPPRHA